MSFSPYIGFSGQGRAAMTDYARIFGAADLQIMDFFDLPADQRPPGTAGLVMHSQFSAGPGAPLMGCDIPPGMGTGGMVGSSIFHAAPSVARATEIFDALSQGGSVEMPLAPSFWSAAFGMLTDRWGTRWMISVAPDTAGGS
jgi:PhnB protein